MSRNRREHEEYLESIEPVGVVVLNDLAYLLEDISEVMMDLAKLQRTRGEDVAAAYKSLDRSDPASLNKIIPQNIAEFLNESVMEIMGMGMEIAGKVSKPADQIEENSSPMAAVDPAKLEPDMISNLGTILMEKAASLQKMVAEFEADLLEKNPPPEA